jgi:ubiquinone/menaquinone biosynthesis C-methylase UbiE
MALYDSFAQAYARFRRPDPRLAAAIDAALGEAQTVANIGAGAGSYEPRDRRVVAIEPSAVMIAQRPADAAPCLQGSAEALPIEDKSIDAAMAILSIHHWNDQEAGLREMVRVARRRIVLLTWVPDAAPFWLTREYFSEIADHDRTIFPRTDNLTALLERVVGPTQITPLPLPHDCIDGMLCAYWRRPELYLDAARRSVMSSFARLDATAGLTRLSDDLSSGRWMDRNGALMALETLDLGYRLVRCRLDGQDG